MTDTTQTQVTGPVDDAIDAELAELISLSHVTNTWEHKRDRLVRSLNARLAPRADALIERDVRERLIAFLTYMVHSEWLQGSAPNERWEEADSLLTALLPRAPMPDVVTISRGLHQATISALRGSSYDMPHGSQRTKTEELIASLEGTDGNR